MFYNLDFFAALLIKRAKRGCASSMLTGCIAYKPDSEGDIYTATHAFYPAFHISHRMNLRMVSRQDFFESACAPQYAKQLDRWRRISSG
jgi:hypothetical protein